MTRGEPRLVGGAGRFVNDDQALLSWISVAWVVLTLCQLAVTVAGNLAVIPLTGVTFPFVSFGMTSLVVNMAFSRSASTSICRPRRAMAERRKASLLDCAIVASVAVVPVLLGVVALVAVVRPADPDAAWRQGSNDRHVSVRHVAALKTFEHAIVRAARHGAGGDRRRAGARRRRRVPARMGRSHRRAAVAAPHRARRRRRARAPADAIAAQLNELDAALLRFSARDNPRVEQRVGLDAARWFDAAARGAGDADRDAPTRPGQQFRVHCADLGAALATLRAPTRAMLATLAWRGTEGSATLARWRPEQLVEIAARDVTRRNPWAGAAGCIYLGAGDGADASASPRYFLAGARSLQRPPVRDHGAERRGIAAPRAAPTRAAPLRARRRARPRRPRRRSALEGAAVAR